MRSRVESECIILIRALNNMKDIGCKCKWIGDGHWTPCAIHKNYSDAIRAVSSIERKSLNEGWVRTDFLTCRQCGIKAPKGFSAIDDTLCGPCYNASH